MPRDDGHLAILTMSWSPNISALKVFVKVAELASFTEAARELSISQPALSRTIRTLEDQFGTRLFDRDTRKVRLTPAGEALLPVADKLLGDFEQSFSELSLTFAGSRGRVVVGALPSLAARILPRAIAVFRKSHPDVEIVVCDTLSGSIERQFHDRLVDLALIAQSQNSDDLRFTPMFEEDFGLACRNDDPLAERQSLTWAVLADLPFIAMSALSSVRRTTDAGLLQAGLDLRPLFECAHLATVGGLIEAGLGVTALPESVIPLLASSQIAWRPLQEPRITRTVGLARYAHRSLSPAAQAFADCLLEQGQGKADRRVS